MLGNFKYIWKCPSDVLDIREAVDFGTFIEKNRGTVTMTEFCLVNIEHVRFVTLFGIITLSSIMSRAISCGHTITVSLPKHDPAKVFIQYFGFTDILELPRKKSAIVIPGQISLKKPRNGKKVFSSRPIYGVHDANQFVNFGIIRDWINQLDQKTKESDFFRTGKFARLVSAELGMNIVTHASLPTSVDEGRESFGVIGMRVINNVGGDDCSWIYKSYPKYKKFVKNNLTNGFVEVCICDPGQGVRSALEVAYKTRVSQRVGVNAIPIDTIRQAIEIIEFAFDEFGTSKTDQDQWVTDAHALSRVLSLTGTYNGILEVVSSNVRVVYNLDDRKLTKNENGIGYKSSEASKFICPFGTNIRMLIPLTNSSRGNLEVKVAKLSGGNIDHSVISMATEFNDAHLQYVSEFLKKTDTIGSFLARTNKHSLIVLDLSGCNEWRSDHFATLIDRLWNILNNKQTLVVGINCDLAKEIEERCYSSAIRINDLYIGPETEQDIDSVNYLSCLTDFHHVLPALDVEGNIYWFGSTHPFVSIICSELIEKPLSVDDISKKLSETDSDIPLTTILSTLKSTSRIFEANEDDNDNIVWVSTLDIEKLENLRGKILVKHLERHLSYVSEALWGRGAAKQAFLLPHSKKYVDCFIEATRLLQEEEFSREVGEVLARLIWTSLEKTDPALIIATTAPSLLLANAIRVWFKELPLIIDIGHYFDTARKKVLDSLTDCKNTNKVVVVQDIIHSGRTLNDICNALESSGNEVDLIISLIRLTDKAAALGPGGVFNPTINGKIKTVISLYTYPMPKPLLPKDIKSISEDDIFWVEPYSLHPFRIAELKKAQYQYLRGVIPTVAMGSQVVKLKELEDSDALRFGHYVYENHHFSIITRMLKLFENSSLADKLIDEIVDSCDAMSGELVFIFPLHSHIRYLVPRLLDKLSSRSIKPAFFFPIVARELGQKPYYMTPHRLEKLLTLKHEARLNNETTRKVNIVIVDDTTATLRTFETILRSIYLAAVKPQGKAKSINVNEIINKIDVWAVINRTGRAKSTFLHSIQCLLDVPFSFKCYAEYDVPVYEAETCPLCNEYKHLSIIANTIGSKFTTSLKEWMENQLNLLKPVVVDSPAFDRLPADIFPFNISYIFGPYDARTMPLACLIFLEIAERGCPTRYLIASLEEFTKKCEHILDHHSISVFREFALTWLVVNSKKLASDASLEEFYRMVDVELTIRPKTALKLLLTCGMWKDMLPEEIFNQLTRKVILKLATLSSVAKKLPSLQNMEEREIIFNAVILFKAVLSFSNLNPDAVNDIFNGLLERLPDDPVAPGDFQGSIKEVVNSVFTFLPIRNVPLLDCLKIASMELLIPPRRASGAARIHCNRIYKHLSELISPDINDEYIEILTKLKGSVGFLDVRSKILCESISKLISGRIEDPQIIHNQLREVSELFKRLSTALRDISIGDLSTKELISTKSFTIAQKTAQLIEEKLFSKTSIIYREIETYNVKYGPIIEELDALARKRKVNSRLTLPSSMIDDTHTVFADDFELRNFFINHSIDVLERHPDITVSIELEEYSKGEMLNIIITSHSSLTNARNIIYHGHSFRFERWGLKLFGGDINLKEGTSEDNIVIICQLLHGYA